MTPPAPLEPLFGTLSGTEAEDTTPAERLAAVHAFTTRCRAWAVAAIARRQEEGRAADDWELYLRFTDHTLEELENGALDHWFVRSP